ncbi:MAG: S8 family serine peptidase [Odoribacteraceae bacterium]|jgi:subtilisin family serine protease|nr:S8 family serine peptidase [Odoribacteraceae bacterium]
MRHYLLIWVTLLLGCQRQPVEGLPGGGPVPDGEILDGWVRVKFRDTLPRVVTRGGVVETGIADLDRIMRESGVARVERVFSDGGKFRERRRAAGLHLWYDLYLGDSLLVTRARPGLLSFPLVEVVEAIPRYRQQSRPVVPGDARTRGLPPAGYPFNDPDLPRQHHYQNDGVLPGFLPGADINLFQAWRVTRGHPDVIVAVIDGGIDARHPDLAANIWVNEAERDGAPGVDDDGNGYVDDLHGWRFDYFDVADTLWGSGEIIPMDHATHCAGIIAAVNDNGAGGCGVAGGSGAGNGAGNGARLMICQTFVPDSTGDPYSDSFSTRKADEAWVYAADNGAVIASCSFSSATLSASYQVAMDYFIAYAGIALDGSQVGPVQGGLIVCAAGNEGNETPRYPAAYEPCIAVAYIMPDHVVSPSSNHGTWVDLVAPGGSTLPAFGSRDEGAIFSTIATGSPNGIADGYGYRTGSSMAAPHVAGVAALVADKFGRPAPGFTADMLKARLLQATRPVEAYNAAKYHGKIGAGLLDAFLALKTDEGIAPEAPGAIHATWHTNSVDLYWIVTTDQHYLPVQGYRVFWSQSPLDDLDPGNPGDEVGRAALENNLPAGDTLLYTIEDIPERSRFHVVIMAVDEYGNLSRPVALEGSTLDNSAPVPREGAPSRIYFERREEMTILLDDYFIDPDGDSLAYFATSTEPDRLALSLLAGRLALQPLSNGFCRVQLSATDEAGARARGEIAVMIRETDREVEFYPNPVTDFLYIRMGKEVDEQLPVCLYNANGSKVLDAIVTVRPFAPGFLDLSTFGNGVYTISLKRDGREIKQSIAKY